MSHAAEPKLVPGRVYRTRDLERWSANAPRLARRLVEEGRLVRLSRGLYSCPQQGPWGAVPPEDRELVRGFLGDDRFVFSGPAYWNALGLGTTQVYARTLVYNRKRTGVFQFGARQYELRRLPFPKKPTPEWFLVDLLEHGRGMGAGAADLAARVPAAVAAGRVEPARLIATAKRFGTAKTVAMLTASLGDA